MLYSLTVMIFGIYIGQEYNIVPSIRILGANLLIYFQNFRDPNIQFHENDDGIFKKIIKKVWW